MIIRCSDCGERWPDTRSFCGVCGACLRPPPTLPPVCIRRATGPTIRRIAMECSSTVTAQSNPPSTSAPTASLLQRLTPLLGLLFSILFVLGLARLLALGGLSAWALGQVVVLIGGALIAEQAWVHGDFWPGLRGMLLWGGLIWLLATNAIVPWALPLLLAWFALHPRLYGNRTASPALNALLARRRAHTPPVDRPSSVPQGPSVCQ
jgi:hypothetical protein